MSTYPRGAAERLGFIDALRGVSALIVVLSHALTVSLAWLPHHDPLRLLGQSCMVVFFVISGFFLPITCEQAGSAARFWIRRFFRLFPIYWVSVALAFAMCCTALYPPRAPSDRLSATDWLINLTMLEDFFQINSAISVYWTLKIELVIYGTFSLLFVLNLHRRTGWLIAGLFAAEIAPRLLLVWHGSAFAIANTKFYYFAPLMGLLAYRFLHGQASARPMVIVGIGQSLLLLASWTIDHALGRSEPVDDRLYFMHAVIWPIGYASFFLALACRRHLSSAVLGWLGKMSYSMYLLHMLVLGLLMTLNQTGWVFYVALFAGTLVLSDMSYRWIEAPSIALGRALEKRLLGHRRTRALPHEPGATPADLCKPRLAA